MEPLGQLSVSEHVRFSGHQIARLRSRQRPLLCHGLITIYDALHSQCAERQGCGRIITYNTSDFERLKPSGIEISTP